MRKYNAPIGPPSNVYRYCNAMYITMRMHYHGFFTGCPKRMYAIERVTYVDVVNIHKVAHQTLQHIARELETKTR